MCLHAIACKCLTTPKHYLKLDERTTIEPIYNVTACSGVAGVYFLYRGTPCMAEFQHANCEFGSDMLHCMHGAETTEAVTLPR